jgi:hypothetical protein
MPVRRQPTTSVSISGGGLPARTLTSCDWWKAVVAATAMRQSRSARPSRRALLGRHDQLECPDTTSPAGAAGLPSIVAIGAAIVVVMLVVALLFVGRRRRSTPSSSA